MFLDVHSKLFGIVSAQALQAYHFHVAFVCKCVVGVVHICNSSAHTSAKISSNFAKDNDTATCHVFTAVVAESFYDGMGPRVSHAKALPCDTAEEHLATCRPVASHIPNDDVVFSDKVASILHGDLVRVHNDTATRKTFANPVICVAFDLQRYTGSQDKAKRLACATIQLDMDRIIREPCSTILGSNFVREHCTNRSVQVVHGSLIVNFATVVESRLSLINQNVVQRSFHTVILTHGVPRKGVGVQLRPRLKKRREVQALALQAQS
mmetsp:Transcript_13699/g.24448  ORF Transcript_13699/g.24448 Transcript_13699/m.24448 type:complete len:266 (+) Transcript_13699:212-1009(+)